jgi:hypothetical protein
MTIHQLLDWYVQQVAAVGKKQAAEALYGLGYNRTLSMMIPMLFDADGKPLDLKAD